MKTFKFISTLLVSALSLSMAAELKIAVINYEKAFNEYKKTVEFKAIIEEKQKVFQEELQAKQAEFKGYEEKIVNFQKQLQDPAVGESIKAQVQDELKNLVQKGTAEEQAFNQQVQRKRQSMQEEMGQQRELILRDMNDVVEKIAKEQGYEIVLDSSSSAIGRTPFVLYFDPKYDVTESIIALMNK